jgi:hypothetical protein
MLMAGGRTSDGHSLLPNNRMELWVIIRRSNLQSASIFRNVSGVPLNRLMAEVIEQNSCAKVITPVAIEMGSADIASWSASSNPKTGRHREFEEESKEKTRVSFRQDQLYDIQGNFIYYSVKIIAPSNASHGQPIIRTFVKVQA